MRYELLAAHSTRLCVHACVCVYTTCAVGHDDEYEGSGDAYRREYAAQWTGEREYGDDVEFGAPEVAEPGDEPHWRDDL